MTWIVTPSHQRTPWADFADGEWHRAVLPGFNHPHQHTMAVFHSRKCAGRSWAARRKLRADFEIRNDGLYVRFTPRVAS